MSTRASITYEANHFHAYFDLNDDEPARHVHLKFDGVHFSASYPGSTTIRMPYDAMVRLWLGLARQIVVTDPEMKAMPDVVAATVKLMDLARKRGVS